MHLVRRAFRPRALAAVLALAATPLLAVPADRPIDRSFPAGAIRTVELENLAGDLVLTGGAAAVRVSGTIHAEESAGRSAAELAQALEVEIEQHGDRLVVRALYPRDVRRFHYPRRASGDDLPWFLEWVGDWSSNIRYQGREVRVSGESGNGAATLWADFRLELPAGVAIEAKNLVGTIRSDRVAGDQSLDTSSGPISARGGRGRLTADSGSGDVEIADHEGDVTADTGSGDIDLRNVRGTTLGADTGSGDVELVDCAGSIDADTGSGNVLASGLVAGASVRADTGSGDVRLAGDFAAVRKLAIDTGSGDVTLSLTAPPSVRLAVSTGSGDIEVDVPSMHVRRTKGEFLADLGSAEGDGRIDTGSGDVRVTATR
jgi:DUF4097 and DUF4098 domain-containing protein YvlB